VVSGVDTGVRGDLEWGTVGNLVRSSAARFGDAPAIVDVDADGAPVTVTFRDLETWSRHVAKSLLAMGIERGDRVAIWATNTWEWVAAAMGLLTAGAALVPMNTRFKGPEAEYILDKAGARVLLLSPGILDLDYVGMLRELGPGAVASLERTIVLRGPAPEGTTAWSDFLAVGDAVDDDVLAARAAEVTPADWSDLSFTSGTTGRPKGATCTHAQLLRGYRDWAAVTGLQEGDRALLVSPFFHSFGFKAGCLASLMMGATIYPQQVFDVDEMFRRIEQDRISVLPGPPTIYQSILQDPRHTRIDLSSLRLAVTGAASIPVELIVRMRDELRIDRIITGYGLTEASGICTMCRFDDDPETIATTAGRAIPDVEIRIADGELRPLPVGETGEILVRGYNVMAGYWDEPEQTAATIVDGWLRTGDIGHLDERGYLRITDRAKDMYIVGGFNAYPAEIENAMLAHDAIDAVAVVGAPDARMGEVGAAFVVLRPGRSLTADELIAWCRRAMANYKVPRIVEFVDALPLTAAGKVAKLELRERARSLVDGVAG
jgi:acyl-CoA synthetase (AMP-forming)/AMP-acid ligase II